MKQKIEWYKEVLELEPASRIFFPLSRMLAEEGRVDEALSTLRQGVLRHPDHLEARFLLVELLHRQGGKKELQAEVDALSAVLGGYPYFWQAWGERLSATEKGRDAGLALAFLTAFLRHNAVSWSEVISYGLSGLLSSGERENPAAATRPPAAGEAQSPVPEVLFEAAADAAEPALCTVPEPMTPVAEDEEEGEEPFSLRTRSMAEVLAEQGDNAGALEIYQELLASAATDEEKSSLRARLEELRNPEQVQVPASPAGDEPGASSRNRLTDMLEALALRLETRSLQ